MYDSGDPLVITSSQNSLVKQIKKLHQGKERHREGNCLLEGTHLLQEAIATNYPLKTVCVTSEWCDRYPQLYNLIIHRCDRLVRVTPEVMTVMGTTTTPDGILGIAPRSPQNLPKIPSDLLLALDRIQDPGNLGTMIRTATAAGAKGIWVSQDSVDLDHPKVLRASAGQWFRQPLGVAQDLAQLVQECQTGGMQVLSTTSHTNISYWEVDLTKPTLVLLGNEGSGLSPELMEMTDIQVKIPMNDQVESLNVGISAALICYEVKRQRDTIKLLGSLQGDRSQA
jgi:TrmH family RNA methyltransferase